MALAQFVREYRAVRRAEGWGSQDPAYYQALPYRDLTGRFEDIWSIRARSYDVFVSRVLLPLELPQKRLDVLDLGAGSGWLAHRLAQRGHRAIALDLLDDDLDGLGALRSFSRDAMPLIAEFDRLPLASAHVDLAVFNASFHYSTDYARTLAEILRVLRPGGTLVILDSPMYFDPASGARMVREREARFSKTYGFASNALPSEHYLTPARLEALAMQLGITWRIFQPGLPWRSRLQRLIGGIRAGREPARFTVIVGSQV